MRNSLLIFVLLTASAFAQVKTFTLTAAGNASGGSTVYTGTITNGASGTGFAGVQFVISGFTNSGNNGNFYATASTATTLTLSNASGVAETHAATAGVQPIQHIIYMIKENRTPDEMFSWVQGTQQYCQGGNSPTVCTNNQATSCTGVGTHSVCGQGWCEPTICYVGTNNTCSGGDTCPQVTTAQTVSGAPALTEQLVSTTYSDINHYQCNFTAELNGGAMSGWASNCNANSGAGNNGCKGTNNSATCAYFSSTDLAYYASLINVYGYEDNHFSTMGGPSQPNHLFLFGATSHESSDNPSFTQNGAGSPGEVGTFTNNWTCGALHTGSGVPYLYTGTLSSTRTTDGTGYYGGTCTNDRTKSCTCYCATGTACSNTFTVSGGGCTDSSGCSSVGSPYQCTTDYSIGASTGGPCPSVTTIADQAEAVFGNSTSTLQHKAWGYYSYNPSWNGALQAQGVYFNSSRISNNIHTESNFDSEVTACTGMCSDNNSTSCTQDSQCNGACIDSGSCTLPHVIYLSATNQGANEHPGDSSIQTGVTWAQTRITNWFSALHAYYSSTMFMTWDDWGGYYDHVPPPSEDDLPTLGFRVPLICIGPYCKHSVVHTQMEFASVLATFERTFGLASINSRDAGATDAMAGTGTLLTNSDGMVNLSQAAIQPGGSGPTTNYTTLTSGTLSGGTIK